MFKDQPVLTPAQLSVFQTTALEHMIQDFNGWADPGDDPVAYADNFVFSYAVRPSGVADLFYYVNDPYNGSPNFPLCYVYPSGKVVHHTVESLDDCYDEKITDAGEFKVTYTASSFAV